MFGCNHVECHCGAHFCYACLLPYTECDGECRDEEEDDYDDVAEDDLDGKESWDDGRNIGAEPTDDRTDMWGCRHYFRILEKEPVEGGHAECHRCFKSLSRSGGDTTSPEAATATNTVGMDGADIIMADTEEHKQEEAEKQETKQDDAWVCACGRVLCGDCKEFELHD